MIGSQLMLRLLQLLAVVATCSQIVRGNLVYRLVDLTASPMSNASDVAGCGLRPGFECQTIEYAVSSARKTVSQDVTITVYPIISDSNRLVTANQSLRNASNIVIDGNGIIAMLPLSFPKGSSFLSLSNSSNITLENFSFNLTHSLGNGVLIDRSQYILTRKCRFAGIGLNAYGLVVRDSSAVLIEGVSFTGQDPLQEPPSLTESFLSAALVIVYRDSSNVPNTLSSYGEGRWSALNGSDVALISSNLTKCGLQRISGVYRRIFPSAQDVSQATALRIHFHPRASHQRVLLQDCTLADNVSPYDPAMTVVFDERSRSNRVDILGSTFTRNRGYVSGALYTSFGKEGGNLVHVAKSSARPCVFDGNQANLEAAVARAAFGGALGQNAESSDLFSMDGCTIMNSLTGFVLTQMIGTIVATTLAETDTELHGGIKFQVSLSNCIFRNNTAQAGSAVYLHLTTMNIKDCIFEKQIGTPISATTSYIHFEGSTTFSDNTGARTGGAISLLDDSLVDVAENAIIRFISNSAEIQGGAIHVDPSTSTPSLVATLEVQFAVGVSGKHCFLQLPPGMEVYHTIPRTMPPSGGLVFFNNSAPVGQDIFANSIVSCSGAPFIPMLVHSAPISNATVTTNLSLAGGPFWVIFNRASCDCFKPFLDGSALVYRRGCSRDQIKADMTKKGFRNKANEVFKQTYLQQILNLYLKNTFSSPAVDLLYVPWSSTLTYWWFPRVPPLPVSVNQTTSLKEQYTLTPQELEYSFSSNVTLFPAPGEEFSLSIDVTDFQLAPVFTLVSVQVDNPDGTVLLRYGGLQYASDAYALFQSWQTLRGLSLAGPPGASGQLLFGLTGQVRDISFQLTVPFRLRPCHPGFHPTAWMLNTTMASEYRSKFRSSRPIPEPGTRDQYNVNALVCNCTVSPGIDKCQSDGYNVSIKSHYWAGDPRGGSMIESGADSFKISDFQTYDNTEQWRTGNFTSGFCWDQFCSYENALEDWSLRTTDPCLSGLKRTAALCSHCEEGYARYPFDLYKCYPSCNQSAAQSAKFYTLILFGLLLIIVICILFTVGGGATFDTWLLFWQFGTFIDARGSVFFISYIVPDNPSSILCISDDLSAPGQVAVQLIFPVFVLAIILITFRLARMFRHGEKILQRFPILPTMWGCLSWGFTYMMYISFQLLSCVPFNGHSVYYLDATVQCFGQSHAPFAALALFILFVLVLPLSLLGYKYRSHPKLKPLIDVYINTLADNRRWWVSLNFFRRFVFICVAVLIPYPNLRKIVIFVAVQGLLFLHVVVMPYRSKIDNGFEAIIIINAALLAGLNAAQETAATRTALVFIFTWPFFGAVGISLFKDREKIRNHWNSFLQFLRKHRIVKNSDRKTEEAVLSGANSDQPLLGDADSSTEARTHPVLSSSSM